MNPFAAVALKALGGTAVAALLSTGALTAFAQTSSPTSDHKTDRRAVAAAILESEADVLGMKPEDLRKDIRAGQKVSDLAKDKGLSQSQFADRLDAALKPNLEKLVDAKTITQAQADRILARIAKGHIPWWNGIHPKKPATN